MDSPSFPLNERYSFETPEQIDVSYAIAGIGSRFIAALIDSVIVGIILFILLVPGTFGVAFVISFVLRMLGNKNGADPAVSFALAGTGFLSFCVIGLYFILFETFWHGQSPGKRRIGIRVIRDGGYPIGFSTAVVRNVLRLIDFLPLYYMIGLIVMFIDRKSRRLGDLAAGTVVVKEQKGVNLDTLEVEARLLAMEDAQLVDENRPAVRNVRSLSADDRQLLREYLRRRSTLPPQTAEKIGRSLAQTFAAKTGNDISTEYPILFLVRLARAIDAEAD